MSNLMSTINECLEGTNITRENLAHAKADHEGALHHAISVLLLDPHGLANYLHRHLGVVDSILRSMNGS